ncbi:hypothetical protein [Cellulomonas wangsupingiae]|uniref:Uncharacterized protein n=1 Tax=Cellulomonas wangsupingiae TaxID=2968085 RepID=A0ABY5K535_9CELL|nr:hypothetical protein [Cellulomonas wangsupingiae]MCC2333625.1 hypothetical protein [Cellulomonas wangsupingiae]UUI64893.1 hypothetical protein NP075_17550 [Cellulomonas wangsupingiae]
MVTPMVSWQGGPPSGELERDPWVRAVRAGELAFAAASNAANFTDEALAQTWSNSAVLWMADLARTDLDHGSPYVALGPRPLTPLAVELDEEGRSALVAVCADDLAVAGEQPSGDRQGRHAQVYRLELGDDGERRIVGSNAPDGDFRLPDGGLLTDEYCSSVAIARGLFDPAPDLEPLLELDGDDVLAPPSPSPSFAVEVPDG